VEKDTRSALQRPALILLKWKRPNRRQLFSKEHRMKPRYAKPSFMRLGLLRRLTRFSF